MNIKIGIVVPVYKVEKYLQKCVSSIISQSYKNWKLILVDDGSLDNCPEMCDDYSHMDARITVVHKQNGGLVSAWMAGLEKLDSSIYYVVFIDSDDWISVDYLKILAEKQESNHADVVVTQLRNTYPDGSELQRPFILPLKFYNRIDIEKDIFPRLLNAGFFHGRAISCSRCGKLIKKELIDKNLHYINQSTTYAEDLNITFPVFLDMQSIDFVQNENCLYYIRSNPDSMTHSYDNNMLSSINYVYNSLNVILNDRKFYSAFEKQLLADFLAASVQYYKNELLNPKGIAETRNNIEEYCSKEKLKKAIQIVDWSSYRLLNKIIIRSMQNYEGLNKSAVTRILRMLKYSKSNRLVDLSSRK